MKKKGGYTVKKILIFEQRIKYNVLKATNRCLKYLKTYKKIIHYFSNQKQFFFN